MRKKKNPYLDPRDVVRLFFFFCVKIIDVIGDVAHQGNSDEVILVLVGTGAIWRRGRTWISQ
jgi:hypothetical protein